MSPLAVAALVFVLGGAISMAVAGLIRLLFLGIQLSRRRPAAREDDLPVLRADEGGVRP